MDRRRQTQPITRRRQRHSIADLSLNRDDMGHEASFTPPGGYGSLPADRLAGIRGRSGPSRRGESAASSPIKASASSLASSSAGGLRSRYQHRTSGKIATIIVDAATI